MTDQKLPGLTNYQLKVVQSILKQVPRILFFGSRVKGTHRPFSDLDVGVELTGPDQDASLSQLREAFQNSDLPFKVDLVNLSEISDDFLALILSTCIDAKKDS